MPGTVESINTKITVYLDEPAQSSPVYLYSKQFDANTRFITVKIMEAGEQYIPTTTCRLNALTPTGDYIYVNGVINSDGTITFEITANILRTAGNVSCDISMTQGSGSSQAILTTSSFFIVVDRTNYYSDAEEGSDTITLPERAGDIEASMDGDYLQINLVDEEGTQMGAGIKVKPLTPDILDGTTVRANGTYEAAPHKFIKSLTVAVPSSGFVTQEKTVTPTKESQPVTPDTGYDGLSKVTVEAIPEQYIDTSDADASAQDIANGKTAYVDGEKITGSMPDAGIDTYANIDGVEDHVATVRYDYTVRAGGYAEEDTTDSNTLQVSLSDLNYSTQEKTVTPEDETKIVEPDENKLLTKVSVNPPERDELDNTTITVNGEYTAEDNKYIKKITVNVAGSSFITQEKTVAASNIQKIVQPDSGYDGLSKVTINSPATSTTTPGSAIIEVTDNVATVAPTYTLVNNSSASIYINGEQISGQSYTITDDCTIRIVRNLDKRKSLIINGVPILSNSDIMINFGNVIITDGTETTSQDVDVLIDYVYSIQGTAEVTLDDLQYEEQEAEVTPSMSEQIITADSGKILVKVKVNKIPSNYGLITWTGTNLIVS